MKQQFFAAAVVWWLNDVLSVNYPMIIRVIPRLFFLRDFLDSWHMKMGHDNLSRNVGKELPLHAA